MSNEMLASVDQRREEIFEAAGRIFARYGFGKTTLDDIAASVGVKKTSLYYY